MSEYPIYIVTALLILGYGLFSKSSEKSIISAPMVFVFLGIVASFFHMESMREGLNGPLVKIFAELTLVLVVFNDASTINRAELRKSRSLPLRLLFIGLPLTMILGILIAMPIFQGMNIWVIALIALILSPTDAALGLAVVTSPLVPDRIRQTINVESGLNDGIALPPILICLAVLASPGGEGAGVSYWLLFVLKQFILGPLIGGLVGWAGGRLVERACNKDRVTSTFLRLSPIAMAIMAFCLAELVHGNGFIASYIAGLMLGVQSPGIREKMHQFSEAVSQALVLFIFLLFGMILIPFSFSFWEINTWIYAILSLTVIRMLPVAISLYGTKLNWQSVNFIGWFGPRGIASVLYLLLVIIQLGTEGNEQMISIIVLTVFLSIILHGISALPLSKALSKSTP